MVIYLVYYKAEINLVIIIVLVVIFLIYLKTPKVRLYLEVGKHSN